MKLTKGESHRALLIPVLLVLAAAFLATSLGSFNGNAITGAQSVGTTPSSCEEIVVSIAEAQLGINGQELCDHRFGTAANMACLRVLRDSIEIYFKGPIVPPNTPGGCFGWKSENSQMALNQLNKHNCATTLNWANTKCEANVVGEEPRGGPVVTFYQADSVLCCKE
jgi:hypothetical protein